MEQLGPLLQALGVGKTITAFILYSIGLIVIGWKFRGNSNKEALDAKNGRIEKLTEDMDTLRTSSAKEINRLSKESDSLREQLRTCTGDRKAADDNLIGVRNINQKVCDQLNVFIGPRPRAIWKHPRENISVILAGPVTTRLVGGTVAGELCEFTITPDDASDSGVVA